MGACQAVMPLSSLWDVFWLGLWIDPYIPLALAFRVACSYFLSWNILPVQQSCGYRWYVIILQSLVIVYLLLPHLEIPFSKIANDPLLTKTNGLFSAIIFLEPTEPFDITHSSLSLWSSLLPELLCFGYWVPFDFTIYLQFHYLAGRGHQTRRSLDFRVNFSMDISNKNGSDPLPVM